MSIYIYLPVKLFAIHVYILCPSSVADNGLNSDVELSDAEKELIREELKKV
jgi:hypothetical protein